MPKTRGQILQEKILEKFPDAVTMKGEINPIIAKGVLEFNRKIAEAHKLATNSKLKFGPS